MSIDLYDIVIGDVAEEYPVISFFEKTWFLWWCSAVFVVVRWFHIFSSSAESGLPDAPPSDQAAESIPSRQFPAGRASGQFV
jgi:hypothetical protein